MKKVLTLILTLILACSLFGCGSSSGASDAASSSQSTVTATEEAESPGEYALDFSETESSAPQSSIYQKSDVKLIRNASLYMEATDLDHACEALENLVAAMGGYLEYSDVYQGGYDSYSYRYASYTARIPSAQYEAFLSSLSDESVCHLVSKSESTENVGQQYADIEAHLEMLNTKLERLNALLAEAVNMTDIISLEDEITSTEYEIASYSSSLNTYDNLIDYSTFTISIDEVRTLTPVEEPSFGSRLLTAFVDGCGNFLTGLQNLLVWVSGHVLGLVLLAAIVVAVAVLLRKRRRKSKPAAHTEPKSEGK